MAGGDFLPTYTPLANDIATQTGVDPSVVLGIIDTETGGGAHVKGNNIFGISPSGPQGQYVAGYPDVETAAQAFVNLMRTSRYAGVAAAGDPASQAAALVKSGYNTVNPNYASIVAGKANAFGKQLGYQDASSGGNGSTSPAPDYNTPAPAQSAQPPSGGSAKQRAIDDLNQPATAPAQPPAPKPGSAKQQAIDDLNQGQPPGALTGPPAAKPAEATAPPDTSQGYFGPDGSYVPPAAMPSKQQASQVDLDKILPLFPKPEPGISILTPQAREAVNQSGPLGRYIANPLLDIAGWTGGQLGALTGMPFQAAGAVVNPLNPQLGRDIAALPEAFPLGGHELGGFTPAGPPDYAAARAGATRSPLQVGPSVTPPVALGDLTSAIGRVPPEAPPSGAAPGAAQPPPTEEGAAPSHVWSSKDYDYPVTPTGVEHAGPGGRVYAEVRQPDGNVSYVPKDELHTAPSPETAAAGTGPEMADAEAPQPQSVGAAATSRQGTPGGTIPDQTNLERARNLRTEIDQSARDRAGNSLVDDTAYVTAVPGGTLPERMQFERDFNPQTALDAKRRYADSEGQQFRAAVDANASARNQGMVDLLRQDSGDGLTLDQLRQARRSVSPDNFGAFDGQQPVNAQGLVQDIQSVLDGPEGKRGAVERTMQSVAARLYDRDGNLETAPSQLYGVRQHIDDLLNKAARPMDAEGTDAQVAQFALRRLADSVDNTIQRGAPRYQAYRDAYRQASQPVNQQRFLQRYWEGGNKLTDLQGKLQLNKVSKLLEDIHKGLTDTKTNLAKSLTDQQIQNVVNVRNELAASRFAQEQAATRGSDSYQLFNRAAETGGSALGRVLKGTVEAGTHAGLGYMATHGMPEAAAVNALMAYHRAFIRPVRAAQKGARVQARANALAAARDAQLLSQQPVNPLSQY